MASRVSAMSVITPSVRISRMKYCWPKKYQEEKGQMSLLRPESLVIESEGNDAEIDLEPRRVFCDADLRPLFFHLFSTRVLRIV